MTKAPMSLMALAVMVPLLLVGCGGGDAGLSRAEVEESVREELADAPAPAQPEPGLTSADVEKAICAAMADMPLPESGLSQEEVERIVEAAIAPILTSQPGLTSADVEEAIRAAMADMPDCGYITVTSLEVAEMTPLTSIGEKVQLLVTANTSDGSSQVVESGLVQWQSSEPWVASVSNGIVTSVGAGNAMITAAYEGRTVEALVSVRISTRSTGTVRVIYAAPSDREFRADASEAMANAIVDLQSRYRRELGGLTFSLYEATPEECRMSQPADYYGTGHAWDKVVVTGPPSRDHRL